MDAVHAPHVCDGKVKVYSSDLFAKLLATFVHKERGTCQKCGAELLGFASFALDGVRIGVRAWFPEMQPPPKDCKHPATVIYHHRGEEYCVSCRQTFPLRVDVSEPADNDFNPPP